MIKYESKNGYTGVLLGSGTLLIYDKDLHKVMHTGSRAINTPDELRDFVDGFPEMMKALSEKL